MQRGVHRFNPAACIASPATDEIHSADYAKRVEIRSDPWITLPGQRLPVFEYLAVS
jgi:hypothetical protein